MIDLLSPFNPVTLRGVAGTNGRPPAADEIDGLPVADGDAIATAGGFIDGALARNRQLLAVQENGLGRNGRDSSNPQQLSEEEQRVVDRLKKRDAEVRNHESAHASAGGPFTSAASFEYQRGPDGTLYAIGGEVKIDVSGAGTPEATIRKAETIKRAALAPAEPSSQDRAVAAAADQLKVEAEAELRDKKVEEERQASQRRDEKAASLAGTVSATNAYERAADLLPSTDRPSTSGFDASF